MAELAARNATLRLDSWASDDTDHARRLMAKRATADLFILTAISEILARG